LIPLCHPLPLDNVQIDIQLEKNNIAIITCECRVTHKTGVEMEALTGATVAALTVYDMVKAVSHNIRIEQTILTSKSGGKREVGCKARKRKEECFDSRPDWSERLGFREAPKTHTLLNM